MSALEKYANDVEKAQTWGSGNWILPGGRMLFEVADIFVNEGFKGDFFIAELLVRESSPTGQVGRDGKPLVPNAVGNTCAFSQNLKDQKNGGPSRVKQFLGALVGEPPANITGKQFLACVSEFGVDKSHTRVSVCRGMLIRCESMWAPQQGDKSKDVTKTKWITVAQTPEEIKARAAALDKEYPLT